MNDPPTDKTLRETLCRAQSSAYDRRFDRGTVEHDIAVLQWVIDALDNGWLIGGYGTPLEPLPTETATQP